MVRIAGVNGGGAVPSRGPQRAAGGSGFSVPERPGAAAGPAATSPVLLASMLALQEGADAPARDRAARRHGQSMLRGLAALQRALLAPDGGTAAALDALAGLLADAPAAADPALAALLSGIRLRVRVELARAAA